jgi:hypothetical protein
MMLSALLLTWAANGVGTTDFPRCFDAKGVVSFHQRECPPGTKMQGTVKLQTTFEPPPPAPPHAPDPKPPRDAKPAPRPPQPAELLCQRTAWKCVVANGEVAYRHDACPTFVDSLRTVAMGGVGRGIPGQIEIGRASNYTLLRERYSVVAHKICLAQACEVLNARRRMGTDNATLKDQQFDTYARNAGRDPCF